MDIYGDDIDTILDAGDDPLNENIGDATAATGPGANLDYADDDNRGDDDDDNNPNQPGIKVEPKRRNVRNPQPRLNAERLIGARGFHVLEHSCTSLRFRGRGHEASDLDAVMKRLEHWAHRLYPQFNFDDFLAKAEKLGRKKQVQTHMSRYRQGLLEPVANRRGAGSADEDGGDGEGMDADGRDSQAMAEPIDEFDDLIGQQIEKYRTAPPRTPAANHSYMESTFNALRTMGSTSTMPGTPSFVGRAPVEQSTPLYMDDIRPLPATPQQAAEPTAAAARLSAEQMARIAENRRLAQERLRAKREAAAAKEAEEEEARRRLAEQTLED